MTTAMAGPGSASRASDGALFGDPELRRFLREYVKKRVQPSDVDDVVQTVLVEALASARRPEEPEEVRKWLVGIARHKCADVHRRAGRERPPEEELPELPTEAPPLEERALVRWAEEQAQSTREADKTLGWMAREGEGDKLEHIAEEEHLPAARVRQRVSRMRRLLKERWLAELALVAALGAVCFVLWRWLRREDEGPIVADPTPPPSAAPVVGPAPEPVAEGRVVRERALEACREDLHQRCVEELDRARELDPEGDGAPAASEARERAVGALEQQRQRSKSAPDQDGAQKVDPQDAKPERTSAPPPSVPTGSLPQAPPKAPPKGKGSFFDKGSSSDFASDAPPPAPPPPETATTPPPPSKPAPPPTDAKKPAPPSKEDGLMQQMTKGGKK